MNMNNFTLKAVYVDKIQDHKTMAALPIWQMSNRASYGFVNYHMIPFHLHRISVQLVNFILIHQFKPHHVHH